MIIDAADDRDDLVTELPHLIEGVLSSPCTQKVMATGVGLVADGEATEC